MFSFPTLHHRRVVSASVLVVAAALVAVPASANTATTDTTFEVNSTGLLTINAPGDAHLGNVDQGGQLSESMGLITVSDERAELFKSWNVYVATDGFTTDVTNPDTTEIETFTIHPEQLTYNPEGAFTIDSALSGNVTTGQARTLDSGEPVVSFQSGLNLLSGDVTWTPAIELDPAGENIPEGLYRGDIVHSVVQ